MSQFDDMDYEYHLNNSINQNNNKMSKTKTEKTETKETRKSARRLFKENNSVEEDVYKDKRELK